MDLLPMFLVSCKSESAKGRLKDMQEEEAIKDDSVRSDQRTRHECCR